MSEEVPGSRFLYITFNPTLISDAAKRCMQSRAFKELRTKHTIHMVTFHHAVWRILKEINIDIPRLSTNTEKIEKVRSTMRSRSNVYLENYIKSREYDKIPSEERLYKTHLDSFLMEEMLWLKANGYITEELYLNCERKGRGINPRLTREQRKTIFRLFEGYHQLRDDKYHGIEFDEEDYALYLLNYIDEIPETLKYDHIFVDEVQDFQPMQIKSIIRLSTKTITFSGDTKQSIYRRAQYSLKEMGLNIDGMKSIRLKTNFRSTKQIMKLAGSLRFIDDEKDRDGKIKYVREGPKPEIYYFADVKNLNRMLVKKIKEILEEEPNSSIAVIHRHDGGFVKYCPVYRALGLNFSLFTAKQYDKRFSYEKVSKPIFYTDAYSVKGLEFDYIFIIHFDMFHFPHRRRLKELAKYSDGNKNSQSYSDDEDIILNDEKKILYVAMTRARNKLCLFYTGETDLEVSQFIRDFDVKDYKNIGFSKMKYSSGKSEAALFEIIG